jgi:hypothetical protein
MGVRRTPLNSTVTSLNLGANGLGEGGGRTLAEALRLNTTRTNMDMGQGFIGTTQELNVDRGILPASVATMEPKETYYRTKRDLLQNQKRPARGILPASVASQVISGSEYRAQTVIWRHAKFCFCKNNKRSSSSWKNLAISIPCLLGDLKESCFFFQLNPQHTRDRPIGPCPCQLVLLMHCTQQEGHGTGLPGLLGVRCNTNKTRRFNQQPSYGVECMSNTNSRH